MRGRANMYISLLTVGIPGDPRTPALSISLLSTTLVLNSSTNELLILHVGLVTGLL